MRYKILGVDGEIKESGDADEIVSEDRRTVLFDKPITVQDGECFVFASSLVLDGDFLHAAGRDDGFNGDAEENPA